MKVVIVQARSGSSRLPDKVSMDLAGRPVLAHVLDRAAAIAGIDQVCCALPDRSEDDALARLAERLGAIVVRGPEADVLARYALAARATEAEAIVRITSDCPVVDPEVAGRVLAALGKGPSYASNVDPRSWPKGLDVEAFTREALELAAARAVEPGDREHVTPWLRRAEGVARTNVALSDDRCAGWRWTLDYPEDLNFLRGLLALAPGPRPGFEVLRRVVDAHPELPRINGHLT